MFGDGGITTLGHDDHVPRAVPAFVGYPLLLALRKPLPLHVAAGLTAAVCVLLAALLLHARG